MQRQAASNHGTCPIHATPSPATAKPTATRRNRQRYASGVPKVVVVLKKASSWPACRMRSGTTAPDCTSLHPGLERGRRQAPPCPHRGGLHRGRWLHRPAGRGDRVGCDRPGRRRCPAAVRGARLQSRQCYRRPPRPGALQLAPGRTRPAEPTIIGFDVAVTQNGRFHQVYGFLPVSVRSRGMRPSMVTRYVPEPQACGCCE